MLSTDDVISVTNTTFTVSGNTTTALSPEMVEWLEQLFGVDDQWSYFNPDTVSVLFSCMIYAVHVRDTVKSALNDHSGDQKLMAVSDGRLGQIVCHVKCFKYIHVQQRCS
jgi:hypothetical protein